MGKFFTPRKISLFLAISLFLSVALARNISASVTVDQYGQALQESNINLEQFSLYNMSFSVMGLTKLLSGYPSTGSGPTTGGAIGGMSNFIAGIYQYKPASSIDYFADLGKNWGIIKPAYAQGFGYDQLRPVQMLWQMTRNLSYLAFVLIFVAVGFMIMLRTRIDPRTVATVQAAIPGIVLSLILVTFSFALAGLIIDIARLGTFLIANILAGNLLNNPMDLINKIETQGDWNIFGLLLSDKGIFSTSAQAGKTIVDVIIASIPNGLLKLLGAVLDKAGITDVIIGLFITLLLVMIVFRIFIMLLTALVTIIMLTILAPFQFLAAAIPGRGGVIFGWFKSMLAAALTFPVSFAMIALAAAFMASVGGGGELRPLINPIDEWTWFPAPLGKFAEDQTGAANLMNAFIGIGILLFTPKVSDILKTAFELKPPPWTGEPGAAVGGALSQLRRFLPI